MLKKLICSLTVIMFVLKTAVGAHIVFDPANYEQNMQTAIQSIQTVLNQATMIKNQIQSLVNQAKNLQNLPLNDWVNVKNDLNNLQIIMQQGNSLSYAMQNISAKFKQLYPDYDNITGNGQSYQQRYKGWSNDAKTGFNDSMQAFQEALKELTNDNTTNNLKSQAETAQGNMQALQIGNELASSQVAQLQRLQNIMMIQANSQLKYMALKTSEEDVKQDALQQAIDHAKTQWPGYQDNGFGHIPTF